MVKNQKEKIVAAHNSYTVYFLLVGILLVAIFLRFYRIEQTFSFSGEIGDNLLAIKNAFANKEIPLLGPPTSHSWLSFGPFYYWIFGLVLWMSKFNPASHAYFGASIATLIVLANYIVVSDIVNKRVGLISSFLIAVSPLFLVFSRQGRFFSIVILLVYPFLWFLYNICQGKHRYLFFLTLIFGSMFSFHFTPLMLIPFVVSVFVLKKVRFTTEELLRGVAGFLLPMLPFFIYDLFHNLQMSKNILLWIPYRIAGFVGLYPKNSLNEVVINENVLSLYDFLTRSFLFKQTFLWGLLCICLILFIIIQTIRSYLSNKDNTKTFTRLFFVLWFLWGYIAIFVHGSPPLHYFVPILSAPIILLSLFLADLWKTYYGKWPSVIVLGLVIIVNFSYYFSPQWFYVANEHMTANPFYIPFTMQQEVTKAIIKDAKGEKFVLKRVGANDQFGGYYAQNYQYLLWLYGNEPENNNSLEYTIYENRPAQFNQLYSLVFSIDTITVIKSRTALTRKIPQNTRYAELIYY